MIQTRKNALAQAVSSLSRVSLAAGLLFSGSLMAGAPAMVSNGNDSGDGSLRAALASGAGVIQIQANVTKIDINSTLMYEGTEPLRIIGWGQTIKANHEGDDFTLLEVSNGANVEINNLRFNGGGGFSLDVPGDGKGIYVKVPTDRTGVVSLKLANVEVRGVAAHGVHISDCTLGDDCGAGSGGGGEGSDASVSATLENVNVWNVGYGKFDADGVRLDERGNGDILFRATASMFMNVGADGVELDEGNDGDVHVDVRNSSFDDNGGYCLNAPLDLAQPCVEDDDGELVLDLDDGFDIDEAGAGSLLGVIANTIVNTNLDEGLDFDEEGDGGVLIDIAGVDAMGNGDEGVKISAEDAGSVNAQLRQLYIAGNGDDGIQIENEGGDVHVRFFNGISMDNSKKGLKVTQEGPDTNGTLMIRGFNDIDELDLENISQI